MAKKLSIGSYFLRALEEALERHPFVTTVDEDGNKHPAWSGSFAFSVSKVTVGKTVILGSDTNR